MALFKIYLVSKQFNRYIALIIRTSMNSGEQGYDNLFVSLIMNGDGIEAATRSARSRVWITDRKLFSNHEIELRH